MADITETDIERLAEFSEQSKKAGDHEMQTCLSVIIPFLNALGYSHEKRQLIAEHDADIGQQKKKKVDYALKQNSDDNSPIILVEAKSIGTQLARHRDQLETYFYNQEEAKIAILTNGIEYLFFSDLDKVNRMDDKPFFKFNLQENKNSRQKITTLNKFHRENFNPHEIEKIASSLKIEEKVRDCFSNMQDMQPKEHIIDKAVQIVIEEKWQVISKKNMLDLAFEISEGERGDVKPITTTSTSSPVIEPKIKLDGGLEKYSVLENAKFLKDIKNIFLEYAPDIARLEYIDEEPKIRFIAYKLENHNFFSICIHKNCIRIWLNIKEAEFSDNINNHNGIAKFVGRNHNGKIKVIGGSGDMFIDVNIDNYLSEKQNIMDIIQQVYDYKKNT